MGFRGSDLRAVLNSVSMPVLYWSVAVVILMAKVEADEVWSMAISGVGMGGTGVTVCAGVAAAFAALYQRRLTGK